MDKEAEIIKIANQDRFLCFWVAAYGIDAMLKFIESFDALLIGDLEFFFVGFDDVVIGLIGAHIIFLCSGLTHIETNISERQGKVSFVFCNTCFICYEVLPKRTNSLVVEHQKALDQTQVGYILCIGYKKR